jgi:hypothetical protein
MSPQSGQSLILGLVLCAAGILAWLLMLQLGQRVHDMSSLHRATDAATYSAALIQARALNMHAYLNRAQVAHQLAMAHIIAAANANQFRQKLAQQAKRRNPPPGLIGSFFGPQHSAAYVGAIARGLTGQYSQHTFRDSFIRHERIVHQVLDKVRQQQLRYLKQQQQQAIHQILIRNMGHSGSMMRGNTLDELGVSVQMTLDDSKDFVLQHSAHDKFWRGYLTMLVNQYGFLDERKHIRRNLWMVNARCPLRRHELRRRGRLILGEDGQWRSEETLSFHALRHNRVIGCYHREYPMGWSVVSTHKNEPSLNHGPSIQTNFANKPFWRWAQKMGGRFWSIFGGKKNPVAQSWGEGSALQWASKGLGQYAQIAPGRESAPVRIALKVKQRLKSGTTLVSEATAQAYFQSPEKSVFHSRGSLFQPYWRATLIPNQNSQIQNSGAASLSSQVRP